MKLLKVSITVLSLICMSAFAAEQTWDEKSSMSAALESTINVFRDDPTKKVIGSDGPSPSNLALVVFVTEKGPQILMAKDYDPRKLDTGKFRPTYGSLKATFGFGLKAGEFSTSQEALLRGSANVSLYQMFDKFSSDSITLTNLSYQERGEEWGPAVTIPVFIKTSFEDATKTLKEVNDTALQAYETKAEGDLFTGRFRDFTLIPLATLKHTGSMTPAVYDEANLEVIQLPNGPVKLWDEAQMRQNLLPHIVEYLSQK